MKSIPYIFAASLALLAGNLPNAHAADQVAIVLDDSGGMCGYLAKNGQDTEYKKLLKTLQNLALGEQITVSRLSGTPLSVNDGAAVRELERIVAGRVEPKDIPPEKWHGNKHQLRTLLRSGCVFHANTSRLENIFTSPSNSVGLTLLITDFIFDGGQHQGGAVDQYDFITKYLENLQGNGGSADAAFKYSAGIIGIRSEFNGTYYFRNATGSRTVNTNRRPVYLFWHSNNPELAKHWIEPILAAFQNNDIALQLLPVSTVIESNHPLVGYPRSLTEIAQTHAAEISYVNLKYEEEKIRHKEQQARLVAMDKKNKVDTPPPNPLARVPEPSNCFKAQGLSIIFDKRCGRDGVQKDWFWNFDAITAVRIKFPLESDPVGIQREITLGDRHGFQNDGSVQIALETDLNGHKAILVTINRVSSGIFNGKSKNSGTPSVDIKEQIKIDDNTFDPSWLQAWSAELEPCPRCDKTLMEKTVDFSPFVKELFTKGNGVVKQNLQNDTSARTMRLEFQAVDHLP